jgi:hypothetical protein
MTAKAAAAALAEYDADLKVRIEEINARGDYWWINSSHRADAEQIIKDVAGTWTLSLAASSAGVSEEMVLVALYRTHLRGGTQVAAAGRVRGILDNR